MKKNSRLSGKKPAQLSKLDRSCAGIDVGATQLFVCIAKDSSHQEVRTFTTLTPDIKCMIQWLKKNNVKSIAMESTGVYWIPPFEFLEEAGFEVLLVNAYFFKAVPGRKTDVQDCQWIQQLHSYGLLRGSFRPSNSIVELRAYVRQRSRLFASAGVQVQLMQKSLIQMNLQLHTVISDITGLTGQNIIKAILEGQQNPKALAELCVGRCRKNKKLVAKALEGNYREEHVFSLKQAYDAYDFFHRQVEQCETAIQAVLVKLQRKKSREAQEQTATNPKTTQVSRKSKKKSYNRSPYSFDADSSIQKVLNVDLNTIPGIDSNTAMKILSEIGTDMSRWRNVKAFTSWLGLCPGNKISGGKILSSRSKPSSNRAAQALRMAAFSLYRSQSYLGAFFRRIRSRLGAPKAITALAHKLAKIVYRMIQTGESYKEVGENHYEESHRKRVVANLKKRASEMGFELMPVTA